MAYKVEYSTVGIMKDGTHGNINQGNGVVYTDVNLAAIPVTLDNHLEGSKRVAIITKIIKVEGVCLNKI